MENPELWWSSSYGHQHLLENPSPVLSQVFTHGICSIFQLPTHSIFWKNPWAFRTPTYFPQLAVDLCGGHRLQVLLPRRLSPRREGRKKDPICHPSLPPAKYIEREEKDGATGQLKKKLTGTPVFFRCMFSALDPQTHGPLSAQTSASQKRPAPSFFSHEKSHLFGMWRHVEKFEYHIGTIFCSPFLFEWQS